MKGVTLPKKMIVIGITQRVAAADTLTRMITLRRARLMLSLTRLRRLSFEPLCFRSFSERRKSPIKYPLILSAQSSIPKVAAKESSIPMSPTENGFVTVSASAAIPSELKLSQSRSSSLDR